MPEIIASFENHCQLHVDEPSSDLHLAQCLPVSTTVNVDCAPSRGRYLFAKRSFLPSGIHLGSALYEDKPFLINGAKRLLTKSRAVHGSTASLLSLPANPKVGKTDTTTHTVLSRNNHRLTVLFALSVVVPIGTLLQGCTSSQRIVVAAAKPAISAVSMQPTSANIQVGQNIQFAITGATAVDQCTWQSSPSSIVTYLGNEEFQGSQVGTAQVSVTCSGSSASANVVVAAQQPSGPIQITSGGTYSGNWNSTDPNTPAVTIRTDQPVTIQNAVISSRGGLISVSGVKTGANVIIHNVTGTALDPEVVGLPRGVFISAANITSLIVKNCSIYGSSSGIKVTGATPSTLKILNNFGSNLEDRASDGQGGLLTTRPVLGHFVLLNNVSALAGAEVAWNRVVQAIGQTSTEDVINIYASHGAPGNPIWIHDNYLEGSSSPMINGKYYTGTALITDGNSLSSTQPTAYIVFEANQVVATAGSGLGIASGHDITAKANRIVSCGMTSSGQWYAWGASAIGIWNYYQVAEFYNNTISGTTGGMVGPGSNSTPSAFDIFVNAPDMVDPTNSVSNNDFTDPCLSGGGVNLQAEDAEREYWAAKISAAGEAIGDQHLATP